MLEVFCSGCSVSFVFRSPRVLVRSEDTHDPTWDSYGGGLTLECTQVLLRLPRSPRDSSSTFRTEKDDLYGSVVPTDVVRGTHTYVHTCMCRRVVTGGVVSGVFGKPPDSVV